MLPCAPCVADERNRDSTTAARRSDAETTTDPLGEIHKKLDAILELTYTNCVAKSRP